MVAQLTSLSIATGVSAVSSSSRSGLNWPEGNGELASRSVSPVVSTGTATETAAAMSGVMIERALSRMSRLATEIKAAVPRSRAIRSRWS